MLAHRNASRVFADSRPETALALVPSDRKAHDTRQQQEGKGVTVTMVVKRPVFVVRAVQLVCAFALPTCRGPFACPADCDAPL